MKLVTNAMDSIQKESDPKKINQIALDLLKKFSDSDYAKLYIYNHDKQALIDYSNDSKVSMIEPSGLLGEAFLKKESAYYNHVASEKKYNKNVDNPDGIKLRSQLFMPIIDNSELMGIIKICRSIKIRSPYNRNDIKLISHLNDFLINTIKTLSNDKKTITTTDIKTIDKNITKSTMDTKEDTNSLLLNISNTVHDIRTPANALRGFLELIEEKIDDEQIKGFVINAKESATLINQLTDAILEESKNGFIASSESFQNIHTVKFFSQITNSFTAVMQDKNIEYIIYIDPALPKEIIVDDLKLRRVLLNLIGNAYKFTPINKRIDVIIEYIDNNLKTTVADTGIGIDDDDKEKIFKEFRQVEDNANSGGTGLGLPISAKFVKELGGKLMFESKIDEGSKFSFKIPIKTENPEPSYDKFQNLNKHITILTNNKKSADALNIKRYLEKLGMPSDKINISNVLSPETTHLFCFQHKLSSEILSFIKDNKIETVVMEESLFSIEKDENSAFIIAPIRSYYGNYVHDAVYSKRKKRILIVDDNKVNLSLLDSILETEYVDVKSAESGEKALRILKKAHKKDRPFDIMFIDKHMDGISGSDLIKEYKENIEPKGNFHPLVVSITGDPELTDEEKKLYDAFITKPFTTQDVRNIIDKISI